MKWTSEQKLGKLVKERYPDKYQEIVRERMAKDLASQLMKTMTLAEFDPRPDVSGEDTLEFTKTRSTPELTFKTQTIHLPMEQWEHIRGMINVLAAAGPEAERLVKQIIYEVENR